ncbi:MAG: HNH endonuclease signature motif containing protein [Actinomycetota bacterium]
MTGLAEGGPLIASHIKPWASSSDTEKIEGFNGLLLSPHIDYLFDAGLISFGDDGELLISKSLDPQILRTWNLPTQLNVGAFRPEQTKYLSYHRGKIFIK